MRAIRVLGGKGLTNRSSHSYIVHAGGEVTELGTAPLAPDGSFYIEVPADRAIAFQAVDAEGRSELNEMSWIYVRPGEQRPAWDAISRGKRPRPVHLGGPGLASPAAEIAGPRAPHRFRGNNAAVTGLMEMQADRFREVASINRHSETSDPLFYQWARGCRLGCPVESDDEGLRISAAQRLAIFRNRAAAAALANGWATRVTRSAWPPPWLWPPVARGSRCRRSWPRWPTGSPWWRKPPPWPWRT